MCSFTCVLFYQDKPWVFAHLLQLQRRIGREAFPLIEQTFFPNARELVSFFFGSRDLLEKIYYLVVIVILNWMKIRWNLQ